VLGTLQVGVGELAVNLASPWRVVTYRELILERAGADWYDLPLEAARDRARGFGLDVPKEWDRGAITHEVYEKLVERTLINPTFVTRLPVELVPLAKACADDPTVVDVFELVVRGRELAPGYSELNDPIEQRKRFEEQAKGDAAKIDHDFIEALEHGMPPAGGMGIGIDRLIMVLTGAESIRDVVLFPQLKPRG
jgi:lysyl-tRNA synthetase class 2